MVVFLKELKGKNMDNGQDWALVYRMTEDSLSSFLEYEAERGASANMMRRYGRAAKALYEFLPEDKLLTRERLIAWRKSMEEKAYAPITIQNYVKYINCYLDFVGCSEIRFNRGRNKDIANRTFGYLTAIRPTGAKDRKDIVWYCQCLCGNTINLPATRLLVGNTLSCGCIQRRHRQEIFLRANKTFAGTNLVQTMKNPVTSNSSASGFVGVAPKGDKWCAYITYRKKRYSLGTYSDIWQAVKVRAAAKVLVMEDAQRLLEIYEQVQVKEAASLNQHTHYTEDT